MINLFYECKDFNVASYADDTTPNSNATEIPSLPLEVQVSATKLFRWFKNNHLKVNPEKSHILLSTNKLEVVSIDGIPGIAASSHEKLLGITIGSELKFENHVKELCLKVDKNLSSLPYVKFHEIRKTQNITESIYRISVQLLSLDMDASV